MGSHCWIGMGLGWDVDRVGHQSVISQIWCMDWVIICMLSLDYIDCISLWVLENLGLSIES
jgi:hypothetical protein